MTLVFQVPLIRQISHVCGLCILTILNCSFYPFLRSHIMIPCKFEADFNKIDPLLDVPSIILINHHLPATQQHRWRLLFSTQIHGESFSSFIHQITNQGPVVIVVRDTSGHVFGGFASMSWAIKSHFVGMFYSR